LTRFFCLIAAFLHDVSRVSLLIMPSTIFVYSLYCKYQSLDGGDTPSLKTRSFSIGVLQKLVTSRMCLSVCVRRSCSSRRIRSSPPFESVGIRRGRADGLRKNHCSWCPAGVTEALALTRGLECCCSHDANQHATDSRLKVD
jgi:hypothetical protein